MRYMRERLIESIAHALHLDTTVIRERNFIAASQMPYTTGTEGLGEEVVYDSGDYSRLLAIARQRMGWDTFQKRKEEAHKQGRRRGLGWSFFIEKSGLGPWEDARARLDAAGQFYCYSGLAALGQGTETILAQLVWVSGLSRSR